MDDEDKYGWSVHKQAEPRRGEPELRVTVSGATWADVRREFEDMLDHCGGRG